MAGYTRNDTANNIADGNIINAADFDGEFNAIQTAFDATNGHKHDGSVGGGAPITTIGPAQEVVASVSTLRPKTDDTVSLGTSTQEFKDLWIDGTAHIDTLAVDENAEFTGDVTVNGNTTLGNASTDTVTITGRIASNIVPDTDATRNLGSASLYFNSAYVDELNALTNVYVGTTGNGVVDVDGILYSSIVTAGTGGEVSLTTNDGYGNANITFNHTAGTPDQAGSAGRITSEVDGTTGRMIIKVADNVSAGVAVTPAVVTNFYTDRVNIPVNLEVEGNTTLGNATSDTITATGRFASSLLPSADDSVDLGSSTQEWRDLWIDGTANIDNLVADVAQIISATGGSLTLRRDDTAISAGEQLGRIDFQSPNTAAGGNSTLVTARIFASATETYDATNNATSMVFQLANDGTVGTKLTIQPDGRLVPNGNVNPSTTNSQDIGTASLQWKDIYVDGTGYIDAIDAEIVDVDNIRIDGNTISSTNANGNIVLTPNGTGTVTTATLAASTSITSPTFDATTRFLGNAADTAAAPSYTWSGDTDTGIFRPGANVVAISTSGAEQMRVTPGGNVGIGTVSPTTKLDVNGAVSNDVSMTVRATTESSFIKVGYGRTGSAASWIDLIGDATNTTYGARLIRGATGVNADVQLLNKGTGSVRLRAEDAGSVSLDTNATSRLYIDSAGNVGIGNTAPTKNLDVHGTGAEASIRIKNTSTAGGDPDATLYIDAGNADGEANVEFQKGGTSVGRITHFDDMLRIVNDSTTGSVQFRVNAADRASFTPDGYLRLSASSDGIQFNNNTASTDALNSYEEGPWTPVLSDGTNNATSSIANGRYTKVGKLVTVSCQLTTTSLGAITTGALRITGLPFSANGSAGGGVATVGGLAIAAGQSVSAFIATGTNYIQLRLSDATTGYTNLLGGEWTATGNTAFSISYLTSV